MSKRLTLQRLCSLWLPLLVPVRSLAQADDTIAIGFAGPLSGSSGKVGQSQQHAVELALQEINARAPRINGRKITYKLVTGDDRGDARTAQLIADYLVRSRVAGVIGHWNTPASLAAAPVYAAAGIPQIAPGSTGPQLTELGHPGVFRIVGHDNDGGAYAASHAARTMEARRVAVIADDTGFGRELAAAFVRSLHDNGLEPVAQETVSAKTSDFNQQLGRIQARNPQLLFFAGLAPQAAILARNLRRMRIDATLMAADGTAGPLFIDLAGPDGVGTLALSPGLPEEKMPGWKAFEKKYRAQYSGDIERFAPFAYDAAHALAAAIQAANAIEGPRVIAALHALRLNGLTGVIAFDEHGNLRNPAYTLYVLLQGKWTPVRSFGSAAR